MPQLLTSDAVRPYVGIYRSIDPSGPTTVDAYERVWRTQGLAIQQSAFLTSKARFSEARQRLNVTAALRPGWDTYAAEPPNEIACAMAHAILDKLETHFLPPTRLMPSVEGGIGLSFVEGDKRADIEIYNTGELVAATYDGHNEPEVWGLDDTDQALRATINRIRVHLAA